MTNQTYLKIPFASQTAESIQQRLETYKTYTIAKSVFYPTTLSLFYISFILATIAISRPKIRRYSSTVYLYTVFLFDLTFMSSWFLEKAIVGLNPTISWADYTCPIWGVFMYIGRIGSLFTTIILGVERILVLTNPTRFNFLATPKTAVLICGICLALIIALSGVNMNRLVWSEEQRKCVHEFEYNLGWRQNLYTTYTLVFSFIGVSLQMAVNVVLGYLLFKKRKVSRLDPIQSSISAARQQLDQLKGINMIVLLMSVISFLSNIPSNINMIFYWSDFWNGRPLNIYIVVASTLRFICKTVLTAKAFAIGVASRDVRREFWLAVTCTKENSAVRSRGIEINPAKLKHNKSKDCISHEDSMLDNCHGQSRDTGPNLSSAPLKIDADMEQTQSGKGESCEDLP